MLRRAGPAPPYPSADGQGGEIKFLSQYFMRRIVFKIFGTIFLAGLLLPVLSSAQPADDSNSLTILTRSDSTAYVIHNYTLPFSHGYHLYRQIEDGDWERLTSEPFYPAQNGFELQQAMGTDFQLIQNEMNRQSPQRIFLTLRAPTEGNVFIQAAIPELAMSLGRAAIDEGAPIGQHVSYRFEILDDLGRAIGTMIEGSARLEPRQPLAPSNIIAENTDRRVMIDWEYPIPADAPETEHVIRFKTFYRDTESGETVDATNSIFVRTTDDTEYRKYITVPQRGREYEFWVEAVDISGQSTASESVTLRIEDNVPPPIISNVGASVNDDYQGVVVWPVSTALDLAGYHVYMAPGDEQEYTRLTEDPLSALQTTFIHEEAEPGVQYRYAVTAVDQSGNESELSNPAHVYIWDYRIPEPVTDLAAEYDPDLKAVNLDWRPVEETGALKTYQILRRQINPSGGELYDQLNQEAHLEPSITDLGFGTDGFRDGVSFEYGVVVVNKSSNRSDTAWAEIQIPDLNPPEPPTSIQVQMRDGEKVQVGWNASVSGDVTSYRIYRHEFESDSITQLSENDKGMRYLLDREVELNRDYIYSVTAVDSVGNESDALESEILTTHETHPPVPTKNVQALYTDDKVILQWQTIDTDRVAGYRIYRSDIATGIFDLIGETDADTLRFAHNGSSPGQWFKVFPVDRIGREARTARPVQAVINE